MARIIVVDDDHSTAALIKMLLELEGFSVTATADINAALAAAKGAAAFIIDCYLAGEDNGIELLERIRAGQAQVPPDIPILMVSGDQRLEDEARSAGADAFLLKPYSPTELSNETKRILATNSGTVSSVT